VAGGRGRLPPPPRGVFVAVTLAIYRLAALCFVCQFALALYSNVLIYRFRDIGWSSITLVDGWGDEYSRRFSFRLARATGVASFAPGDDHPRELTCDVRLGGVFVEGVRQLVGNTARRLPLHGDVAVLEPVTQMPVDGAQLRHLVIKEQSGGHIPSDQLPNLLGCSVRAARQV